MCIKTLALAEDLTKNGEREVFFELNGQSRSVRIKDNKAQKELHIHPKVDKTNKNEIGAPLPGTVIDVRVNVGDKVEKGTPLIILSSMKMETVVQSPVAGHVRDIHVDTNMKLEAEDLVITIE